MEQVYTLITGASSDIGKNICFKLAANEALILHGRDFDKLNQLKNSLPNSDTHLIWQYDFANAKYVQIIFGWTVIQEIPLLSAAHWSNQAIVSYIFVPIFLIGLTWFAINCQACLARTIRGIRLANSIYEKRLDNVKFDNLKNFKYLNGNITFTNENAVNQNTSNNKKESGNNPNS